MLLVATIAACGNDDADRPSPDRFYNPTELRGPGPLSYLWSRFGFGAEPWAKVERDSVATVAPVLQEREMQEPVVTWLGQSTVLIQVDRLNIITDPMLTEFAGPIKARWFKRASPLVIRPEGLPPIDLVIISHDHYDHLDLETLARLPGRPLILMPLRVGSLVTARLGASARVAEMDWWSTERFSIGQSAIEISAMPAQHGSGRTPFDRNKRLRATWSVVINNRFSFFFAGDTGYDAELFERIGCFAGPFDLALLPIGSYLPRAHMQHVHTSPAEAVLIHHAINSQLSIGIHWGTFAFSAEPLAQPALALADLTTSLTSFVTLKIGQSVRLQPRSTSNESRTSCESSGARESHHDHALYLNPAHRNDILQPSQSRRAGRDQAYEA